MASDTEEFKKGKGSPLFCFCCLLCFLRTSVVSLLQRNLLLLRCVRFQTFRSSSDILLPLLRAALSGLSVLVCSVLSTLPPTLLPSLRTGPLHRATAASSSTKRILEGWVPGISEYGHPHRITWVGTVTLVTTTTRNKRLQHRQLCASGFLFFLLRGLQLARQTFRQRIQLSDCQLSWWVREWVTIRNQFIVGYSLNLGTLLLVFGSKVSKACVPEQPSSEGLALGQGFQPGGGCEPGTPLACLPLLGSGRPGRVWPQRLGTRWPGTPQCSSELAPCDPAL